MDRVRSDRPGNPPSSQSLTACWTVYVADVWIERHKVTNAELAAFLNAQGRTTPTGGKDTGLITGIFKIF